MRTLAIVLLLIGAASLISGCGGGGGAVVAQSGAAADYSNYEQRLLTMHNQARQRAGAGALSIDPALTRAAQQYAQYLDRTGRSGHVADGSNPAKRTTAAGYRWPAVAENMGQSNGVPLDELFDAWMKSSIHRGNLLNPRYTDVGFGHAGHKWIVVFAKPK